MAYREFVVPPAEEFLRAFGVEPEPAGEEPTILAVRIPGSSGESVELSFDVPGRSVRFRWFRGSDLMLDLFREGAVGLTLDPDGAGVTVHAETDDLAGDLHITVKPGVSVRDALLLH